MVHRKVDGKVKMRLLKILFVCLPALSPVSLQISAQNMTDTIIHIEEVSVTGHRSLMDYAINKNVMGSVALKENLNRSLAELLSMHSPVYVKSYGQGSLATVSFRGTSASHTRVSWNGMNINNPMIGQTDMSLIPAWFIDEISLLNGSSSMIHGAGALGGSIQLTSMPDWKNIIHGSIIQGIGSFGTYQTFTSIGGGTSNLQIKLRLVHEQSRNDFAYLNTANGLWNVMKQQDANYTIDGIMGEIAYRKGTHTISAHLWMQGADRNLPPIMSYEGNGRIEYQQDLQTRGSLIWTHYGRLIRGRLTSGYSKSNLKYYLANTTDGGYLINYNSFSTTESLFNNYTAEAGVTSRTLLRGTISYNYHAVSITDEKVITGFTENRSETGAALSVHHLFNQRVSGYMMMRGELVDQNLSPVMPSLGMELQPFRKESVVVKWNAGRNYHQPTMNDLYWIPGGNPALLPEEGYTSDLTVSYTWEFDSLLTVKSELTGYLNYIDNWIMWQPGEYRFWQAENIREVFARGLEYSVNASLKTGSAKVDLAGNYAFTRTGNMSDADDLANDAGKQLIYIPVHKGSGTVFISYRKFDLSYGIYFTGERYTNAGNENTAHTLPAYTLHNISAGRRISMGRCYAEVRLKADNLFDTGYQAILWRPMPGRNYTLMLKLAF